MSALSQLTYIYTYGGGSQSNRVIKFQRTDEANSQTIYAKVYAIVNGQEKEISHLDGEQIIVETKSTTDKMKDLRAARLAQTAPIKSHKKLSELGLEEQIETILQLRPQGTRRICISNGFGDSDTFFEKVQSLAIFDPT